MVNHIWLIIYGEPHMSRFINIYGRYKFGCFDRIWMSIYG